MSVSSLGDWLGVFALTLSAQRLSGRPELAVGGVLLFRVLPALIFAPFAGVLADRFDRRRLMITADVSRALLICSIPWIDRLWVLFPVSAAMEMLSLMWTPAKDATVPNLVERDQLLTANQLSLITTYGTFPLGGLIVAVLATIAAQLGKIHAFSVLREHPENLAFFVDAGTFLFSAAMVASLPRHLTKAKRARTKLGGQNALRDLAEGLRFVRSNRIIRTLVGSAWVAFTGGAAVISLGPIFAKAASGNGDPAAAAAGWGSLIVAVGIGLVSGMITAGAMARRVRRERIFPIGLIVSGAAVVLTASTRTMPPAVAATVFIGLGAGVAWVTIFTLLQERVEDRLRGRTFATLYSGVHLSLFLGLAGWPLLAGLVGNRAVTVGGYEIDLSGYRIMLWAGGLFLAGAGIAAARSMGATRRRVRLPRMRGLEFASPAISGGARNGLFVVFEGVEGSGKTTQIKLLRDFLVGSGRDVLVTREPGGTAISERIRNVLLDPGSSEMDPKTEALLYAAARAQHVAQVIRPALEQGRVVLCDRFIDSSLAYQGLARGLGEDDVLQLNRWATDQVFPDLVVLLDVDPEIGLARTEGNPDRMEQEDIAFHRKVRDAYQHLAKQYPSRFALVDASRGIWVIQAEIQATLKGFLRSEP
jgi:dTMP kinase